MDEAEVSDEAGRNEEKRMRPVVKGEAPEAVFQKYSDAEPYLEERLGLHKTYRICGCIFGTDDDISCKYRIFFRVDEYISDR